MGVRSNIPIYSTVLKDNLSIEKGFAGTSNNTYRATSIDAGKMKESRNTYKKLQQEMRAHASLTKAPYDPFGQKKADPQYNELIPLKQSVNSKNYVFNEVNAEMAVNRSKQHGAGNLLQDYVAKPRARHDRGGSIFKATGAKQISNEEKHKLSVYWGTDQPHKSIEELGLTLPKMNNRPKRFDIGTFTR